MTKEFKNNGQKNIWSILNIEETTDIKKIRHGYAVMSKSCHPEKEPEKFQQLYQAYQEAIKRAKAYQKQEKNGLADERGQSVEKSAIAHDREEQEKKTEESKSLFSAFDSAEQKQKQIHRGEYESLGTEQELSFSRFDNVEQEQKQIHAGETESSDEEQLSSFSMFNHLEQNQKQTQKEETENIETESVFNRTYENLFRNITPFAKEGLASFKSYFESQKEKDWKKYVTTPAFLRAQYDETFAKQLAEYLKSQTIYLVEQLPYDMVKELYFSYYPFLEEQTKEYFENGFHELFKVLFQNQEIEEIEELHEDPSVKSEIVKYQVYYKLYHAIKKNGANQRVKEWELYITDAAREMFIKDGKTSYRDKHLFSLLAFLIEEAPVLPDDIYILLIEKFNLFQLERGSKTEEMQPLYQAISSKCVDMSKFQQIKINEKAERRQLTAEIEAWYYEDLTDEDRPRLREYFNSGLFYEYRLDSWLLDYRLVVFALEYKSFPKVFLEEYLAFYDKIYEQTGSDVGRRLYQMFVEYLAECDVKVEYNEVDEHKKEWVLQYFFEESFTRVWSSGSKASMKPVYKGIVMDHFKAIADKHNYEWDLWNDGHLKAERSGENYIFSYDKVDEQVTLSLVEYFQIVEEMLEVYMGRYFMSSIEKNGVNELKERAREVAYGNHRN